MARQGGARTGGRSRSMSGSARLGGPGLQTVLVSPVGVIRGGAGTSARPRAIQAHKTLNAPRGRCCPGHPRPTALPGAALTAGLGKPVPHWPRGQGVSADPAPADLG